MTLADDILKVAAEIVHTNVQKHGNVTDSLNSIAGVWNGILEAAGKPAAARLDGHDVANLMEGLKIARRYTGAFNHDNYIDGAGYAACAFEVRARRPNNG